MAGFQKYRIPRRLAGTSWMINKNWKMNTIGVAWTAVCLGFLTFRQLRNSSPVMGQYVDPTSNTAPRLIDMEAQ